MTRWEGLDYVNRVAIFRYLRGGELGVLERLPNRSYNQTLLQTDLLRSLNPRSPDERIVEVLAAEGCASLLGPWLASWMEEEGPDEFFLGSLPLTAPADQATVLRLLPRFYREGRLNSAGRFLVRMPGEVTAELESLLLPGLPEPAFIQVLRDEIGEHPLVPPPNDPPELSLTELLDQVRRGWRVWSATWRLPAQAWLSLRPGATLQGTWGGAAARSRPCCTGAVNRPPWGGGCYRSRRRAGPAV